MNTVTIEQLIEKLEQQKDKNTPVEYIICDANGKIITAFMKDQTEAMSKVLKVFG